MLPEPRGMYAAATLRQRQIFAAAAGIFLVAIVVQVIGFATHDKALSNAMAAVILASWLVIAGTCIAMYLRTRNARR